MRGHQVGVTRDQGVAANGQLGLLHEASRQCTELIRRNDLALVAGSKPTMDLGVTLPEHSAT